MYNVDLPWACPGRALALFLFCSGVIGLEIDIFVCNRYKELHGIVSTYDVLVKRNGKLPLSPGRLAIRRSVTYLVCVQTIVNKHHPLMGPDTS